MPPPISTPPATCSAVIRSESRTSAKTAATNGCRFAISVAREGPIPCSARNQRTFVSTSGPSVAKTRSTHTHAETP